MQESVALKSFRGSVYKLPEQIVLVSSQLQDNQYIPELQIADMALNNNSISYTAQKYRYNSTQYGQTPNLIIRTQVFTRYQIINALAEIQYDQLPVQRKFQGKIFIENISKSMNLALKFYKQQTNIINSSNHIKQLEVKKQIIEQFQLLSKILEKKKFTFDIVETEKDLSFADIVIFCYLKSIITNIPNSYPDHILRTAYSNLFKWYVQRQSQIKVLHDKNKIQTERYFQQNKVKNAYQNGLESYINWNWKRFGISFGIAAVIYGIFSK